MLKKFEYMKHYTSICNSVPSEIITLIALRNQKTILERNNKIVADNLKIIDDFFDQYQDLFSWIRPQGGCIGFAKYKGKENIDTLCHQLVNKKGVLLMPASIYNHSSQHFRIGFGRKNMAEALNQFEEFIKASSIY